MKKAAFFVLIAAIILGAGAVTVMSEAAGIAIKDDSKVAFDYTLTVDGKVMDSSQGRKPLEFTEGDGKIIPGLAKQLIGMHAGEEKTVVVAPQDAYGNHDSSAIKEVPLSQFPADMKPVVGMTITAKSPSGQAFPVKIAEVKKDALMIDFNHPLAGKTLTFKVKIVSVT